MARPLTLLTCLVFTLAAASALAQDRWPPPRPNWWKGLKPGETATFDMKVTGMTMRLVMTVEEIRDGKVTYSTRSVQGGQSFLMETKTLDVRSGAVPGAIQPPGATIVKGADTTLRAGGRTFVATEYTVKVDGKTMQAWHSPDLAPIFNGGNVRFSVAGPQSMSLTLVDYAKGR